MKLFIPDIDLARLGAALTALYAACAVTAALEALTQDEGMARSFRLVCACAIALSAVKLMSGLLG